MRRSSWIAIVFAWLVLTPSAHASLVVVPDDYTTIQTAIDSGADTVLVKPGDYPEMVTTSRGVVVMGAPPPAQPNSVQRTLLPVLAGFSGSATDWTPIRLAYLRFSSAVAVNTTGGASSNVFACRFDAGLTIGGSDKGDVYNCLVFGDLVHLGFRGDFGMNTVVAGSIRTTSSNSSHIVHDNVVVGPAPIGIVDVEDTWVRDNYVRGCDVGIQGACSQPSEISGNIIEDCASHGIEFQDCQSSITAPVISNVIRRCGGRGISAAERTESVLYNIIEDTGGDGIHHPGYLYRLRGNYVLRAGGTGIRAGLVIASMDSNVVIGSSGDGIAVDGINHATGNILGRNAANGLVVGGSLSQQFSVRRNTAYLNGGVGFDLGTPAVATDSITHNIAFGNSVGLSWSGPGTPYLACNDWYANPNGAVVGAAVGATDLEVDPKFCDLPNDIVTLAAGSPLASVPGCGPIGALGVGCAVAVGVGDPRPASLGRLRILPQPSRGAMQFAWQASADATTLEVFDVRGARRMRRALPPHTSSFSWNGHDDEGAPLPAGVYFAKLVQARARSEATVVVIR